MLQEHLQKAWQEGKAGSLSPSAQAKAWAYREVWREEGKSLHGLNEHVAARVYKVKQPGQRAKHPSGVAIAQLYNRIDEDPDWFPGKNAAQNGGRKRALSAQQANAIATSAMALKERRVEPTFPLIAGLCPNAVLNPTTGEAVHPDRVYEVFKTKCHDGDPNEPWKHQARLSKKALTDEQKNKRVVFGRYIEDDVGHRDEWYFRRCIWTDLCNKILPLSEKKASQMALAKKGKKGWVSDSHKDHSRNLRGGTETLKQKSWDTIRVWWAPILAQGKLHVVLLGPDIVSSHSWALTLRCSLGSCRSCSFMKLLWPGSANGSRSQRRRSLGRRPSPISRLA